MCFCTKLYLKAVVGPAVVEVVAETRHEERQAFEVARKIQKRGV